MDPGQAASLAPSGSNLRSFRSKCTVFKKVLVTLLGLFGAPIIGAREIAPFLLPIRYALGCRVLGPEAGNYCFLLCIA